jgi:hypothetical protein
MLVCGPSGATFVNITGQSGITVISTGGTVTIKNTNPQLPTCQTNGTVLACGPSGPSFVNITGQKGVTVISTGGTIIIRDDCFFTTDDTLLVDEDANGNIFLHGGCAIRTSGSLANTATIEVTGGGLCWNDVTGATVTMTANNGYVTDFASTVVTLNLPSTATFGDVYAIVGGANGAGWIVQADASQTIHFGNATASLGNSLSSTNQFDSVEILCISGDGVGMTAIFTVKDPVGNIILSP